MSSSINHFKHESLQDCISITKYFNAISEGFCNGYLSLSTGAKCLLLKPHGLIRLEVKANRKDGQAKLSLQFRWNEEEQKKIKVLNEPLTITPEHQKK